MSYLPGVREVISSATRPAAIPVPTISNLSRALDIDAFLPSRRQIASIANAEALPGVDLQ